jgi:hypothetical protein
MSSSQEGSVKGKWWGRKRVTVFAVYLLHHQVQGGLQVAHGDALVDDHALDLMEHGGVGGVHLVLAVDAAGREHADGQGAGLHGAYLHGEVWVRRQDAAVLGEIEGVRPLAGGMVGGVLSLVKLYSESSTSGPSRISKPMPMKMSFIWSSTLYMGCLWPISAFCRAR